MPQMLGQKRMQWNVALRCLRLGVAVPAFCPASGHLNPFLIPQYVCPAQRQNLGCPQSRCRAGEDKREMEDVGQRFENGERLSRAQDDSPVVSLGASLKSLTNILHFT